MPKHSPRLTVAVVTGTRAEFGLLRPVMDAIALHPRLRLKVIAAGSHLLPPARTILEVRAGYPIAATVPMQKPGEARTRHADALAVARGIDGFARAFAKLAPDWVVVLGDRIEAFAAASAASIAGIAVAHIHGGDRAEGIADEAMRHAISKLSHLHCAGSVQSARRLIRMGEAANCVVATGSPAIDGLRAIKPLSAKQFATLGSPRAIVLMHPSGDARADIAFVRATFAALEREAIGPVLVLAPNADAGSDLIRAEIARHVTRRSAHEVVFGEHLPRELFLRWMAVPRGSKRRVLIGNSSAGLIECAALGCPVVNLGHRQAGRERASNVIDVARPEASLIARAIRRAADGPANGRPPHPFGDGRSGARIAALLARTDPHAASLLRKRNSF